MALCFGEIELDLDAFELRRDGRIVHVEPQVFEVVRHLVVHRDRLVSKEELLEQVWGTRFVSESALTSRIKDARRALGDDGREQRIIKTVHGRGYRFVAPVTAAPAVAESSTAPPAVDDRARLNGPALASATAPPEPASANGPVMLEREAAMRVLHDAATDAAGGRGRVVLVAGEPGIGKTSLVRAFLASEARLRVLVGSCDDLVTPLPLCPLRDVAGRAAPELAAALENPAAGSVQRALLDELARPPSPTVLVVEDVHWADEATIDVLTFVCRRLADLPALIVLTYRGGEVVGGHPVVPLLGSIPTDIARRVTLPPLSPAGVAQLVGEERAAAVLAATGGVPFFVTELAAMGADSDPGSLPVSVGDAVMARVARLPEGTAQLLDLLAVEPSRTDVVLLDALRPSWPDDIEAAERSAVVNVQGDTVSFRHELARRAVLDAVPAARRRALHREVATALVAMGADPAHLVHHAEAGGDAELLVEQAWLAGRQAAAAAAHREGWSHYQRVLPLLALVAQDRHAELFEEASHESYAAGDVAAALELAMRALEGFRRSGDDLAKGRVHRWLSRIHWYQGRRLQSEVQAQLAVKVLEPLPPSAELAWAYSNLSQLAMLAWRHDEAMQWGERAIALAEELGADDVLVHALVNVGTERTMVDLTDDAMLKDAIVRAKALGFHHEAARAMVSVAYRAMDNDLLVEARAVAEEGVRYAEQHEVETLRQYLVVVLGRTALLQGRWDEAELHLRPITASQLSVPLMAALTSLALLEVRRGDDATDTLARAWPLVEAAGEAQRLLPLVEVEAERAWLEGRLDPSLRRLQDAYAMAGPSASHLGRLSRWLQEAGGLTGVPGKVGAAHAAELEGRWAEAAAEWRARGMPYEEAMALARTGPDGSAEAMAIAERLGATPLQRLLAAGLLDQPPS